MQRSGPCQKLLILPVFFLQNKHVYNNAFVQIDT